jgi:creatinine amidohydrolase
MARLAELNWQEYQHQVATALMVLPVGAVETHGAHLPLNTDTIVAEYLADNLATQVDALVLPTIHFGVKANPIRLGGEFPGMWTSRRRLSSSTFSIA